jgi:NAD(P)H-dependent FMN reductase
VRIGALSGSLGPGSANAAALTTARHAIRSSANRGAEGVEVVDVVGLDTVPPFRPDRVDDPSPEVASFRAQVEGVDGLLVAAPEYAGGLAGVVKNALDWLVGSASLYRRCVAVLSAGTTGGVFAIDQLVRTLSWQGALVVATLGIDGARTKRDASGAFVDGATVDAITRWANELVAGCTEDLPAQIARTEPILRRHGVDPARHGEG